MTKRFKHGDTREDGYRFWSYKNDGEVWKSPEEWEPCRERNRKATLKRCTEMSASLSAYKLEKGCEDCGYDEHSCVLQFDHLPGCEKLFNLAQATTRSPKKVWAEVSKCSVVCANCHAIRTHARRQEDVNP